MVFEFQLVSHSKIIEWKRDIEILFTMMLLWLTMLITQPILIKYKKWDLHRTLGKVSYFLVPFILVSIFLVGRVGYLREGVNLPPSVKIGLLALSIPNLFAFSIWYVLSMVNKSKAPIHMRYMIATSLLLIGPGLGRLTINYGGASLATALVIAQTTAILISLALLLYDVIKHRPFKPFIVAFIVLSVVHLSWLFRMTMVWQEFGGSFAKAFY
jgi:hypothetical protein